MKTQLLYKKTGNANKCGFPDNSCLGCSVMLGAIIAFGVIALQVAQHGALAVLDGRIAQSLHRHAVEPMIGLMRLLSLLHGPGATGLLALPLALYFWRRKELGWLLLGLVCVPGGMLLNELIKLAFQRSRPVLEQPLVTLTSYSFPSGHAAAATVLYGLAACYAMTRMRRAGPRAAVLLVALVMVALVGFSRIYLGAHYLSDVLAGAAESCAWLALCLVSGAAWERRYLSTQSCCNKELALATIAVIINASAGLGYDADWSAQLTRQFAALDVAAEVTLAHGGDEMITAAKRALARGVDSVVAGGGVALGVLPLGTLNHFAKDLSIPLDLDQAIATIARGTTAQVDVGDVNGRIFVNNSSLGLYPHVVRARDQQQRRLGRGKWTAFGWALVAALRRFPFLGVRLTINGVEHARRTPFVFIGNNDYQMQGFRIGARERLDGGALSLYVAQRPTRLGLLRLAWHALRGHLAQARDFDVMSGAEFTIETRHHRLHVATYGEVNIMQPPLRYRSRPAALTVLVPLSTIQE